jgi:hypothetical protein
MNQRIENLWNQAAKFTTDGSWEGQVAFMEKFAQLLVSDVLREVDTRAYVSGDRAWSDDLDRPWIELEYGFGPLADAQRQAGKIK